MLQSGPGRGLHPFDPAAEPDSASGKKPGEPSDRAHVPLSEMFGYTTDLRSNTQGRGSYSMEFYRYEQVPALVQERIVGGP